MHEEADVTHEMDRCIRLRRIGGHTQDDELGWHALVKDVTYEMDRCTRL